MTHDNNLLVKAFILDTLSEAGEVKWASDKLTFKNDNHDIKISFSEVTGFDELSLRMLLLHLAKRWEK